MSYDDYKLSSPFNKGSGWYETEPEKEQCALCLDGFETEDLFQLEPKTKIYVCSECLNDYHNQEP